MTIMNYRMEAQRDTSQTPFPLNLSTESCPTNVLSNEPISNFNPPSYDEVVGESALQEPPTHNPTTKSQ